MSDPLQFTGERYTPECVREIRYEHLHRYVFARGLVAGRNVLDAACGEGYGSALLAETASQVTGVDVSGEAVEHASKRYHSANLEYRQADCLALPFPDGEFDCVVSFETLEHLDKHEDLMAEFRRVLSPNGFLLISTPDKAIYTDQQGNQNEFHVAELYREEFESLLGRYYPAYRLWGQKLLFQSSIWSLQSAPGVVLHQEGPAGVSSTPGPEQDAVYLLALCAGDEALLPDLDYGLSLFDDAEQSVYEHYYHEIQKNMAAGGLLQERDREIAELKAALAKPSSDQPPWWRRLLGQD